MAKLSRLVGLAIICLLGCGTAKAETITYSADFGPGVYTNMDSFWDTFSASLQQFDTSLGTLNSATLSVTFELRLTVQALSGRAYVGFEYRGISTLSGSNEMSMGYGETSITINPEDTIRYQTVTLPGSASGTITDATALSALSGLGTVDWQWSNPSGHTVSYFANDGSDHYSYQLNMTSSRVSITYDYIPEPSTVGLLVAAGVMTIGCCSSRRRS